MQKEKANKVYDLLVSIGGADEPERTSFIYHHCESKHKCDEWRFSGKLGFGGKYWRDTNSVGCYKEDETNSRMKIINELNDKLKSIT